MNSLSSQSDDGRRQFLSASCIENVNLTSEVVCTYLTTSSMSLSSAHNSGYWLSSPLLFHFELHFCLSFSRRKQKSGCLVNVFLLPNLDMVTPTPFACGGTNTRNGGRRWNRESLGLGLNVCTPSIETGPLKSMNVEQILKTTMAWSLLRP